MTDIQGGINFLCQRCQQPLKLSSTLYSLDEHTLAELSLPISPAHNIDIEPQVRNCLTQSSLEGREKVPPQKLTSSKFYITKLPYPLVDGAYSIDSN